MTDRVKTRSEASKVVLLVSKEEMLIERAGRDRVQLMTI